jgi:hypothetical protein
LSDFDRPFCKTLSPAPGIHPPAPSSQPTVPPSPSTSVPSAPQPAVPPSPSSQPTVPPAPISQFSDKDREAYFSLNAEGTRKDGILYRSAVNVPFSDTVAYTKRAADFRFPYPIQPNAHIISFIVGVVNITGSPTNIEKFKDIIFYNRKKDTYSFEYWINCVSYGRAYIAEENVAIVPYIPVTPAEFDAYAFANKCSDTEIMGITEKFRALYGPGNERYRHVINLIPPTGACKWSGLANLGCHTACQVWMQGKSTSSRNTWYHEFGHNMGLSHAQTPSNEYGDNSGVMGLTGDVTLNAVNRFHLGWGKPIVRYIDPSKVPIEVTINSLDQTIENNMLLLHLPDDTYYVSYRTLDYANKEGGNYSQKLSIHTKVGSNGSMLHGTVALSESFIVPMENRFDFIKELNLLTVAINAGNYCKTNKKYDGNIANSYSGRAIDYSLPGAQPYASINDCGYFGSDYRGLLNDEQFDILLERKKQKFIEIFKNFKEMKIKYVIQLKSFTSNPATATVVISRDTQREWSFSQYVKDGLALNIRVLDAFKNDPWMITHLKKNLAVLDNIDIGKLQETAKDLDRRTPDVPLIEVVNFLNLFAKFDIRREDNKRTALALALINPEWLSWLP